MNSELSSYPADRMPSVAGIGALSSRVLFGHILLSALLFSVYCIWFRTPLVADDHRFLWLSKQDGFDFWGLGQSISRTPFIAPVYYFLLKLDYYQSTFYFFFISIFCVHSASVFLIAERFLQVLKIPVFSVGFWALLPGVFLSFHPNFLEILFMPGAAVYVLGGLFMAISFFSGSWLPRLLFSLLAFGTYETYVLPVFAFYLLPLLIEKIDKASLIAFGKKLFPVLIAFLAYVSLRFLLAIKTGSYNQPVTPDLLANVQRLLKYNFFVFTVGYSHRWSSFAEFSIILVLLGLSMRKKGLLILRIFLAIILSGLLSGLLDLMVPYEGIRVIYGSFFFKTSALIFLFRTAAACYNPRLIFALIFILVPVYGKNLYSIYRIRMHNYQNQKDIERLVAGVFQNTEPAKTLLLPPNPLHFHPQDWALEPNSTIQYKLFRFLQKKEKEMAFRVIGFDSMAFHPPDLPVFYPSRAFVYQTGPNWERDGNAVTGQVYRVPQGAYGKAIYGPYIRLEAGRYRMELHYRCGKKKPRVAEFGGMEINSERGRRIIASSPLRYENQSSGFSLAGLEFDLPVQTDNLEFGIFTNGQIDFYIDYMRISKI